MEFTYRVQYESFGLRALNWLGLSDREYIQSEVERAKLRLVLTVNSDEEPNISIKFL